jgi:hypothetical protein
MSLFINEDTEEIKAMMRDMDADAINAKFKIIVEPYGEDSTSEESFTALFTQLFSH